MGGLSGKSGRDNTGCVFLRGSRHRNVSMGAQLVAVVRTIDIFVLF